MDIAALSVTANETKLFKHLDSLQSLQNGKPKPVLLCVASTNRCNLSCPHCCFADRDKEQELDPSLLVDTVEAFQRLGLKSVEFTGGGEPTLYPWLECVVLAIETLGLPMGINTNCTRTDAPWEKFAWTRIGLNTLDNDKWRGRVFTNAIEIMNRSASASACYIVRPDAKSEELRRAVLLAGSLGLPLRLAPDCRQPIEGIAETMAMVRIELAAMGKDAAGAFLSDFNTPLGPRANVPCRVHLYKPMLAADGWIYCCPSSELALENPANLGEKFRVCRAEDVAETYSKAAWSYAHNCSFCKYEQHNKIFDAVTTETNHNEFG